MKIKVTNLGAIGEGVIDMGKRINLLCGYNGTGKTYMAYIVYGLLRNRIIIPQDDNMADSLLKNREISMPIDFSVLHNYRKEMLQNVKRSIDSIFGIGIDTSNLIFDGFDIEFAESDEEWEQFIIATEINDTTKIQGVTISIVKNSGDGNVKIEILDNNITDESESRIRILLQSLVYYTLSVYPISNADVFPVERNSIYTFSKELSIRKQEAMDNLQLLVDKEKKISKYDIFFNSKRYPLPIKDGLLVADDLTELKKNKSQYFNFAESIESELLHGKVQISNDGDIQFRPDKTSRKNLPIQMAASIVKTMSSLIVYLKYIAIKNDLIIIDEPEINLHPDNQIILARIFARLANKGFRLLVSTHSDYIIREFNNLVMLSDSSIPAVKNMAAVFGYQQDEFIAPNELGVYHFSYKNQSAKKVTIKPVPVGKYGFGVDSIDEVIDRQNDINEKLYYAIKYDEQD